MLAASNTEPPEVTAEIKAQLDKYEANLRDNLDKFVANRKKRIDLREAQTKIVANLIKHAHKAHIIAVESMIVRYRAALLKALEAQRVNIVVASTDQHELGVVLNNLTQEFQALAHTYVPQACDLGMARALRDMQSRGWLKRIKGTPKADKMVADSILVENIMYLKASLLPAMHAALYANTTADNKLAGMEARIGSYAHYLWKSAERSYIVTLRDAFAKIKVNTKPRKLRLVTRESIAREGGEGSGNFGHAGRPGEQGGSGEGAGVVYDPDVKHSGRIEEIRYLPLANIYQPESEGSEVDRVSDDVARGMDFSEPVQTTAFRDNAHNGDLPTVQLIDGNHRYAAARQTGRTWLPVTVDATNARGSKLNALIAMSREIEAGLKQ